MKVGAKVTSHLIASLVNPCQHKNSEEEIHRMNIHGSAVIAKTFVNDMDARKKRNDCNIHMGWTNVLSTNGRQSYCYTNQPSHFSQPPTELMCGENYPRLVIVTVLIHE